MEINIEGLNNGNQVIFDTQTASKSENKGIFYFKVKHYFKKLKEKTNNPHLKGNPACLICLNINSYMGGASDVWYESRGFSI